MKLPVLRGLEGRAGDTLEDLGRRRRLGFAHHHHLHALTLQRGVLAAHVAGADDVTFLEPDAVARIQDVVLAEDGVVGVHELPLVHEFLREVLGVARVADLDLAHHLADDDLEAMYSWAFTGPRMLRMSVGEMPPSERRVPART